MKEIIDRLTEEIKYHRAEAEKRYKAVKALQAVCPHPKWEDDGHDSHNSYERCTVCGVRR